MKKIITLIILLSFFFIGNANANNLENKLYKSVTITKMQIEKDYWKKVNEKIVSIFTNYRYEKDIKTLTKLEKLLKEKIIDFKRKNILSTKEKKKLNLYNNLFYRTSLLLRYNLK